MSEPVEQIDPEFDAQLRGLFEEAERSLEQRAADPRRAAAPAPTDGETTGAETAVPVAVVTPGSPGGVAQMLRPLAIGLDSLRRTSSEHSSLLRKMDGTFGAGTESRLELAATLRELRTVIDQRNGVNQRLFDALHEELRSYKDGFLIDAMHRPIIRDLISLYDDLAELHRQICETLHGLSEPAETVARIKALELNIENHLSFVLEILARLDVTIVRLGSGQLDKHCQRAVAIEMTESESEDLQIARVVKRGFLLKDRIFRAEEVVIKKFKDSMLATPSTDPKKP